MPAPKFEIRFGRSSSMNALQAKRINGLCFADTDELVISKSAINGLFLGDFPVAPNIAESGFVKVYSSIAQTKFLGPSQKNAGVGSIRFRGMCWRPRSRS